MMSTIKRWITAQSGRARRNRQELVRSLFDLDSGTRLLDLGSEDGSHVHAMLRDTDVVAENVFIADIDEDRLLEGRRRYGFTPVPIPEDGRLPFPDGHFDLVFCSSVIEHVTVPKEEVWTLTGGAEFRRRARERQREFAREVRRLGRGYFVQTPYRHFPVESHTWLPLMGWLPRPALVRVLKLTNRFWIKRTAPDWRLLDGAELSALFPDARILRERFLGLTKSLMAVRTP